MLAFALCVLWGCAYSESSSNRAQRIVAAQSTQVATNVLPPSTPREVAQPKSTATTTIEQYYRGENFPHWVGVVLDRGVHIKLEDGSVWEVAATDRVQTQFWFVAHKITVERGGNQYYPFRVTNTDKNEIAYAKLISE